MKEVTMDNTEIKASAAKMIGGAGLAWYSVYSLQEWVAIVTIGYVLLQIGLLMPKYWVAVKNFFTFIRNLIKRKRHARKHKRHPTGKRIF